MESHSRRIEARMTNSQQFFSLVFCHSWLQSDIFLHSCTISARMTIVRFMAFYMDSSHCPRVTWILIQLCLVEATAL